MGDCAQSSGQHGVSITVQVTLTRHNGHRQRVTHTRPPSHREPAHTTPYHNFEERSQRASSQVQVLVLRRTQWARDSRAEALVQCGPQRRRRFLSASSSTTWASPPDRRSRANLTPVAQNVPMTYTLLPAAPPPSWPTCRPGWRWLQLRRVGGPAGSPARWDGNRAAVQPATGST